MTIPHFKFFFVDTETRMAASLGLSILFLIAGSRISLAISSTSAFNAIKAEIENQNIQMLKLIRSTVEGEVFDDANLAHKYANDLLGCEPHSPC